MNCTHCGNPLVLEGEQTTYYPAWSEMQAEIHFDDDGTPYSTWIWSSGGGSGDTTETTYTYKRMCCDALVTNRDDVDWGLWDLSRTLFETTRRSPDDV